MAREMSSSVRATKDALLQETTTLQSAATATGNGTAARPKSNAGSVVVRGITTATVKVEGSLDGTNYFQIGSDITADGIVAVTVPCSYLRARISAYTSGTIHAHYFE